MRYRDAGVDIARADAVREAIGEAVRRTWNAHVRPIPGGFAGVMSWGDGAPLMAATMDGVGTKLHLALAAGRVGDAAADLVYHGANDLLAHGGRPVAFLDYVAQARLDPDVLLAIVQGLARACEDVGAVLLGGETAEMPDTYVEGVVDVAGCMLGRVNAAHLLDGSAIRPGDVVLGLGSDGLHTNGFSLARRVLEHAGLAMDATLPGGSGEQVGAALLAPHRWYGRAVLPQVERGTLRAVAHVTGGGLAGNLVRVVPDTCDAVIDPAAWPRPPVFDWLCTAGAIPEDDARSAFNLGIGLAVVCAEASREAVVSALTASGETVFVIGEVRSGRGRVTWADR